MNPKNPTNATAPMLYLLRHGATIRGPKKRYIGQTDIALSDLGRRQAHWWQKELSAINFDAIYCSDLSRASDTAQIVAAARTTDIQATSQLREINLGDWDGVDMPEIREKYPDAWLQRGQQVDCFRPPEGESFQDLQDRVLPVVESVDFDRVKNVLMVSHAGVNRVILCRVLKKPLKDLFLISQGAAALNQIVFQDGQFDIVSINRLPE